jgi:phosphoglycolate phosphatase
MPISAARIPVPRIPLADIRLIVFDLDGTLIDSRLDLCNSVNAMLAHVGRDALPENVIADYIGDGAGMLVRRALENQNGNSHSEEFVQQALLYFLDYYREHKLDFTTVYPGVMESLTAIRAARPEIAMAVLTNKPVNPSRILCEHFGLSRFMFQNYGGNSFPTKKPDPEGLLTLIAEASALSGTTIATTQTVLVGDSEVDVATAKNAGVWSVACSYGLSPHTLATVTPDATVHSASEWTPLFGVV